MIVVDSSVWIDFFRGVTTPQTSRLVDLIPDERLAVGDLIAAEVLKGFAADRDFSDARRLLAKLFPLLVSDANVAIESARNYRMLRAKGIAIRGTIDTLIATRCILDDLPLLYSGRDFDPFVQHLGLRHAMVA